MGNWCDKLTRFVRAEDGATAVEYAIMLGLIITVCVSAVNKLGANTNNLLENAANVTTTTGS